MFQKFLKKATKIKTDRVAQVAIGGVTQEIEQTNRERLERGKRKDNSAVRPAYKNIKYKGRRTPVDLKLSGDFHRSIRAKPMQRELDVGSDHTVKGFGLADFLEGKYSGPSSIYGLPNKELIKLILPGVIKQMRSELQK